MIKIISIQQIDELVAEQLGWRKTNIGWYHPSYPNYERLPRFTENPHWNNKILDYLVKEELVITTEISSMEMYPFGGYIICRIKDIKARSCEPVEQDYDGYIVGECRLLNEPPHTLQLALCLSFLDYMGIEFTLSPEFKHTLTL